jgi:hypothetical protein
VSLAWSSRLRGPRHLRTMGKLTKAAAGNLTTVSNSNHALGITRRLSRCGNSLRWRLAFCTLLCLCLCLACSKKTHSVTLTWQAPAAVPRVTIVGYNLYRSTTSGGPFVRLASNLTILRYEDRLVGSGRTYFYVVTAIDQAGRESRYSNEARAPIP